MTLRAPNHEACNSSTPGAKQRVCEFAGAHLRVCGAGGAVVTLDGRAVEGWAFTHNNVLTWPRGEGQDAGWLQLLAAPGGTQLLGCLQGPADDASARPMYNRLL